MKKNLKKMLLLLTLALAVPMAAHATATIGDLTVTKYSDGKTLVKIQVNESVHLYAVLTSAQMTDIRDELLPAGSGTAPTYNGATMPTNPHLGNLLD